jgi:hypothetical protein
MHIERTNGYSGPGAADSGKPLPRPGSKVDGLKNLTEDSAADATSGLNFAQLVQKAPDVNTDAVAEARRLLESGQLSTPDAIRRAAEGMVRRGI